MAFQSINNQAILCYRNISCRFPFNQYIFIAYTADSGRILFGKDERRKLPMASTTKIMTCILVLEQMKEDQKASVSDYAVCQPKDRKGVV